MSLETKIDPTAVILTEILGEGTKVYSYAKIREKASIGERCDIRNLVYIDVGVAVGNDVKIMDGAKIYRGVKIEEGVFIGPGVLCLNDNNPRQSLIADLTDTVWTIGKNASIGGGSIILAKVNIGEYALVGAGSVVTKDVPNYGLVYGNPARLKGFVCEKAHKLEGFETSLSEFYDPTIVSCKECMGQVTIRQKDYQRLLEERLHDHH